MDIIRDYMQRHDLTQKQFAVLVGVTQAAVSAWLRGSRVTIESAQKIERGTAGEITVAALRPDIAAIFAA